MLGMILLESQQLVRGLLREQLDSYPLVIHGNLGLSSHICPSHCIPHTSRTIFIFLDRVNELISCFDINLAGFDDLLKYLGILSSQFLHFTYGQTGVKGPE